MKSIEARAVISAADKTGGVFDKLAAKIKGVEKSAQALGNVKAPKFTGNLEEELRRLKLSEKELMGVRDRRQRFMDELRGQRPKAEHYFRAQGEWMDREVNHWRKMKAGIDEAASAHKRWRSGMAAAGAAAGAAAAKGFAVAGGAYGAYRVGRAGVKSAAENQRESARDYLAGLSPAESKRLEDEALRVSGKYQSIDSQTAHERLRDTAMSTRSVDTAMNLSETIGQMTTVLQSLKGKDKAIEEGRKFFTALDVLGKNLDPKEFRELAEGYTKALGVEGADMDLGGVLAMSKRLKAAGATISNRFLMTTGVGLGRDMGDERAGNAIAMMMQQEVQATKGAKAYGIESGLRDKNGKFVDRSTMMRDPDYWAWKNISAAMRRKKLDPSKPEDVNTYLQSAYSNSSARDVLSKLMTQREQYEGKAVQFEKAPGLEAGKPGPGGLQGRDPFVAYEAVFAQLRTLAGQAPIMDQAASALNKLSGSISGLNDAVSKNSDWFKGAGEKVSKWWDSETRDAQAIWDAGKKVLDWDKRTGITPPWAPKKSDPYPAGDDPMGKDYSARQQHSAEYWGGLGREGASAASAARLRREAADQKAWAAPSVSQTMTYGTGLQNQASVERSAEVSVRGDIEGQVEGIFKVEAGSELLRIVDTMQRLAIEVRGRLSTLGANSNGPGSTGRSSPDAQAPGGTGFGGGGM